MIETFKNTIKKQKLITQGDHIVVALSGGADSVCLLHLLLAIKDDFSLTVSAVHINHQLRGKEADEDETFVKVLCEKLGVSCFCERLHVKEYAITNKLGIEDAGRKLRYECLESYRQRLSADSIATAHHSDDNTETVLMHFLRGAGIHGLTGIPYRNGHVIRPLLDISKEEILKYVKENAISFATDSTNCKTVFTRNKIRLQLLPELEQYNPSFRSTLKGNIALYQSADAYLQDVANHRFKALATIQPHYVSFPLTRLHKEAEVIRYYLYSLAVHSLLPHFTASSARIFETDNCVLAKSGSVSVGHGITAHICYDKLYFIAENNIKKDNPREVFLPIGQETQLPDTDISFFAAECKHTAAYPGKNTLYLSRRKVNKQPLHIRFRRNGDFFYPSGFGHKKSVQNFFVDEKIPRFLRNEVPILTVGNEIAWICGYRADERFLPDTNEDIIIEIKFTKEKTK